MEASYSILGNQIWKIWRKKKMREKMYGNLDKTSFDEKGHCDQSESWAVFGNIYYNEDESCESVCEEYGMDKTFIPPSQDRSRPRPRRSTRKGKGGITSRGKRGHLATPTLLKRERTLINCRIVRTGARNDPRFP